MSEEIKTVEIPAGKIIRVKLIWVCPVCGSDRGETVRSFSCKGSSKSGVVDAWLNPCGHIDYYDNVVEEAKQNGLNPKLTKKTTKR